MATEQATQLEIVQTVLAAVSAYVQLVGVGVMVLCYWKRLQEQGQTVEGVVKLVA